MKKCYRFFGIFALLLVSSSSLNAQNTFFTTISENAIDAKGLERIIKPEKFNLSAIDIPALKSFLWALPTENTIKNRTNSPILTLPMPDGSSKRFYVWQSSIQDPALEAKFPEIKTFAGQGIDDPYATIRFDLTPFGFHAQILSINGDIYMDPYARGSNVYNMSYFTNDNRRSSPFRCEVPDNPNSLQRTGNALAAGPCRGTQLYTYRLAVSCTGEYAAAVGGTTAPLLHAAIVTSVNRVSGVYETEFTVRLILIANNDIIEFTNAATDPYTGNNNGGTLINESQTQITNRIGSANFDIGHTFSTGGGGLAGLGVVCINSQKASGVTGLTNPVGDNYDIDYVAHEMGHQFGGNHTFNSVTSSCSGNRNRTTAYEVGSATTIMGYAGICSTDDIQPHSDPFFHSVSFDEISNYMESGGTCKVAINNGNNLPQITSMDNNNVTIPIGLPFTLTASATDADGDALTYCWEEWDITTNGGAWNSGKTSTTAPLFKSRIPKASGSRNFPDMAVILANYPANPPAVMDGLKGETLPTVARAIKFRLTVRDNRAGGGGVVTGGSGCQTGYTGTFQINTAATPNGTTLFAVTIPNGGETWQAGSTQTVTWNIGGTTASPFSTANVKITLSTDGGYTYPIVVLSSTTNDGSESITVPNNPTTTARMRVEAVGNVFFDISNANFTITSAASSFTFTPASDVNVTCGSAASPTTLLSNAVGGFNTPITLTYTSSIPGTTVSFGTNPLTPGNSTTVTLNNANTLAPGTDTIIITGVAGAITQKDTILFVIQPGSAPVITTQPSNQTVCAGANATFTSASSTGGVSYQWQVSTNSGSSWSNVASGGTSASYTVNSTTTAQNNYQYRVIISTLCGTVTSNAATLTINTAPAISVSPASVSVCAGSSHTFSSTATGTNLTYQWQVSTNSGTSWSNVASGGTSATYQLTGITIGQNGYQYQVIVSGTCTPSATSAAATLTVSGAPSITTQPSNVTQCAGTNATFNVTASGSGLTYQWQVNTGGGFANVASGGTSASYTVNSITAAQNNYQYQVVVSGAGCATPTTSSAATLTVNTLPAVTTQPSNQTVCAGATATFTAAATGTNIAYQWQVNTGSGFSNVASGGNAASYTTAATTAGQSGYQYQVVVSGTCTPNATSSAATLTVNTLPTVTTQPAPQTVCAGASVTFTAAATGTGIAYQWQENTGSGFNNISGANSASYTINPTNASQNGNQYQLVVSGTCSPSASSNSATLTLNAPTTPTFTQVPAICSGGSFSLSNTSTNNIAGNWSPAINNSNTTPYTFTPSTGQCATSTTMTVTVNPLPIVNITANPGNVLFPGQSITMTASASPVGNTYSWLANGVLLQNQNNSTLSISGNSPGSYSYSASVTDANGCTSTSDQFVIDVRGLAFIYPNPNSGQFFISFEGAPFKDQPKLISLYDAKGSRVYSQYYTLASSLYQTLHIDVHHLSKGVYVLVLSDIIGNPIRTGKVVIE